ncbi:MAG: 5'-3' exonuclease H3TH domain-containing protein [Acidimicrobiales bacterium]
MKLMLIDGNSLAYRAFFALPTDMATSSGQVTNAVFGFTSMLINLLRDHRPDAIAVAFDRPEPTFRHEQSATYKANRNEAPDILRQQLGLVRQVIDTLEIPTLEQAGVEADDIIATLATEARDRDDDVIIVTGDRDSYQLVEDPLVKVLYNRRGVSDYAFYDEAGITERTGVHPTKYVQYAALRGDPSDNLPGVPGVGEKTAAKLINTYGGIDGIFAHVDEQTPKLRQNLTEHEAVVRSNAELMVLRRNVPLEVDLDSLVMGDYDVAEVRKLFDFLEFRTLFDRLGEALDTDLGSAPGAETQVLEAEVTLLATAAEAVAGLDRLASGTGPLAVEAAYEGVPHWAAAVLGLAMVAETGPDSDSAEVVWLASTLLDDPEVRDAFARLIGEGPAHRHPRGQTAAGVVAAHRAAAATLAIDTALAAYLIDPADTRYQLQSLLLKYANLELPADATAPDGQLDFADDGEPDLALAAGRRALAVARLAPKLSAALGRRACAPSTTRSRSPSSGCWPAWRSSASGSTRSGCEPSTTRSRPAATS